MSENNQQQTYQLDKLHEKLIELLWKIKGMGKIGDVIIRTVKETVTPQERIIACFYHLELSEEMKGKEGGPTFYSCEIHLVTTLNYIVLGFYPSFHSYHIKSIHHISDLRLENRFSTGYEEEQTSPEDKNYAPAFVKFNVTFAGQDNNKVGEWVAEATRPESVDLLLEQVKILAKCVGYPLSKL